MRTALAVGRKEFWQIVRDRRTLTILLFVPAFFLMLYGYALNWDIRHVRLAVLDREHKAESRELVSSFVNSTYFDVVAAPASMREIERLMDRGQTRVALVIPEGMTRDLRSGLKKYAFPDHHWYGRDDYTVINASGQGADFIITTEKDIVKLDRNMIDNKKMFILETEMRIDREDEFLQTLSTLAGL